MKRWLLLLGITLALLTATASVPALGVQTVCGWAGDPRGFTRVGDSITADHAYLYPFGNEDTIRLAPDLAYLWYDIGFFKQASFERTSRAAVNGITSQGINDPSRCDGRTLVACELTEYDVRTVFMMAGTNDPAEWLVTGFTQFNIESILRFLVESGRVPVLFEVPGNVNKDVGPLNQFLGQLADKYGVYLIHNAGVTVGADGVHPTAAPPGFEASLLPDFNQYGQTVRNRESLIALDRIRTTCKWY